jgi:hypothetical protein
MSKNTFQTKSKKHNLKSITKENHHLILLKYLEKRKRKRD